MFRTKKPGDSFHFARRGVTKPLKKWMNEQGFSEQARAQLPLLAQGGEVLWIYGEGFDGRLAVQNDTQRVILIHEDLEELN